MIQKERASTSALKKRIENKLREAREEALKLSKRIMYSKKLTEAERAIFYSGWIFSAVHLFCSTSDPNGITHEEIAQHFRITRARTNEIMTFLTSAGLCVEDKGGRVRMSTQSTFVEKGSPHLLRHHSNWRIKAIQKCEALTEQEMMYTGQVSLSRKDFALLRERLASFLTEAMKVVKDSPAEGVAALNIDLFWVD